MAEPTTPSSFPSFLAATIRAATRFMWSADATEEPPYFWTTRATGPQATDVGAGTGGWGHLGRRMEFPDGRPRGVAAHRRRAWQRRDRPAGLDRGQPCAAARARCGLLRP